MKQTKLSADVFQLPFQTYVIDEMAKEHGHTVLRLPPYHCILNPIEKRWSYHKHLVLMESTVRTEQEALETCKDKFQQIPGTNLSNFFKNAEAEEEGFWKRDGLLENLHPQVLIPLYDEDDEEDDNEVI